MRTSNRECDFAFSALPKIQLRQKEVWWKMRNSSALYLQLEDQVFRYHNLGTILNKGLSRVEGRISSNAAGNVYINCPRCRKGRLSSAPLRQAMPQRPLLRRLSSPGQCGENLDVVQSHRLPRAFTSSCSRRTRRMLFFSFPLW